MLKKYALVTVHQAKNPDAPQKECLVLRFSIRGDRSRCPPYSDVLVKYLILRLRRERDIIVVRMRIETADLCCHSNRIETADLATKRSNSSHKFEGNKQKAQSMRLKRAKDKGKG